MTGQPEHVLVVGAGLAGLRTAEQLRSAGYQGRLSLVGAENHAPYDRPPLSKQVLAGDWDADRIVLRTEDGLDDLGVRTYLGTSAVALRPGEIELSDGASLHGDAIVLATGLGARTLPDQPKNVFTLRTLDNAMALRAALDSASSLLVVGGGFIGAEVASTARAKGIEVTVLEAGPAPSIRALGPQVAELAARLMVEGGVDLRTGVSIDGFVEPAGTGEHRAAVALADGERIEADVAIVGIGGTPQLDWLDGLGLDLTNGVPCGPTGRVDGLDGVWAVGDIAAWALPDGAHKRTEHWASAGDEAAVVARDILGAEPPPPAVPYFWSDQFGLKIQLIGEPNAADSVLQLHGTGLDGGPVRGTVVAYLAGDDLVAVAGFGAARLVARYRPLLAQGANKAAVLDTAASLS